MMIDRVVLYFFFVLLGVSLLWERPVPLLVGP